METNVYCSTKPRRMKKVMLGFLVITAGALMLLFNMNILPEKYEDIFFSWEMLLIAIGLINIASKDNWFLGTILILVGGFFMSNRLIDFPVELSKIFWPVIIIIAGVYIVIRKGFLGHSHFQKRFHNEDCNYKTEAGFINDSNVFGGSKRKLSPCVFKGGKITNIFGGSEIDLTQTTLADGKTFLKIEAIFGGVSLIVPSDWIVHVEVNSVLGGFNDKRNVVKVDSGSGCELFIKGSTIFGGGEIKSY